MKHDFELNVIVGFIIVMSACIGIWTTHLASVMNKDKAESNEHIQKMEKESREKLARHF